MRKFFLCSYIPPNFRDVALTGGFKHRALSSYQNEKKNETHYSNNNNSFFPIGIELTTVALTDTAIVNIIKNNLYINLN